MQRHWFQVNPAKANSPTPSGRVPAPRPHRRSDGAPRRLAIRGHVGDGPHRTGMRDAPLRMRLLNRSGFRHCLAERRRGRGRLWPKDAREVGECGRACDRRPAAIGSDPNVITQCVGPLRLLRQITTDANDECQEHGSHAQKVLQERHRTLTTTAALSLNTDKEMLQPAHQRTVKSEVPLDATRLFLFMEQSPPKAPEASFSARTQFPVPAADARAAQSIGIASASSNASCCPAALDFS